MNDTLPTGMIPLDAAVVLIAGSKVPYRDEAGAAWTTLCQLIPEGRVTPLLLDERRFVREADRRQFLGFKDKYWKFASALLFYPRDDHDRRVADEDNWKKVTGEIEREPSYDLLDERGQLHRNATLIFSESELEGVLASVSEPTGDSPEVTASPEKPSLDEVREPDKKRFPISRMPELVGFLTNFHRSQAASSGSCSENAAWEEARSHFSKYIIPRALRRPNDCGLPGKAGEEAESRRYNAGRVAARIAARRKAGAPDEAA